MSTTRPLLLDLFCCAGGAAMGYYRAGFDVLGVDIAPQKHYPFSFIKGDALEFLGWLIESKNIRQFGAIHASPPCQDYSSLHARYPERVYPQLIEPTRELVTRAAVPWVIENVMPAQLLSGITLCGAMFGLRTYRHRRLESSHLLYPPAHPKHVVRSGSHKGQTQRKAHYLAGGFVTVTGDVGTYCGPGAMGIDWMNGTELSQAIPPAYTEWIGGQLLQVIA